MKVVAAVVSLFAFLLLSQVASAQTTYAGINRTFPAPKGAVITGAPT